MLVDGSGWLNLNTSPKPLIIWAKVFLHKQDFTEEVQAQMTSSQKLVVSVQQGAPGSPLLYNIVGFFQFSFFLHWFALSQFSQFSLHMWLKIIKKNYKNWKQKK